jgi:hypothetical protein
MKRFILATLIACSIGSIQPHSCVQLLRTNSYNVLRHSFHIVKRHPYTSGFTALAVILGIYWYSIQNDYDNE